MDYFKLTVAALSLASGEQGVPIKDAARIVEQDIQHVADCSAKDIPSRFSANIREGKRGIVEKSGRTKIEEDTLTAIRGKMLFNLRLGGIPKLNALPITLGRLTAKDMNNVYYIKVTQQDDDWSCVRWAAYNAKALDTLVSEGRAITSANILELTLEPVNVLLRNVLHNGEKKRLFGCYGITIARNLGVSDIFVLSSYISPGNDLEIERRNDARGGFELFPAADFLPQLRERLRDKDQARAIHFVCEMVYTPEDKPKDYHAMLMSVIKRPYQKPFIVILDSLNFRFPKRDTERQLTLLYRELVAPFYQE
jgi:hypothetical protein